MPFKAASCVKLVTNPTRYHSAVTLVDIAASSASAAAAAVDAVPTETEFSHCEARNLRRSTRIGDKTYPLAPGKRSISTSVKDGSAVGTESRNKKRQHIEMADVKEEVVCETVAISTPSSPAKKSRKAVKQKLLIPYAAPTGWEETYSTIWEYRFRIEDAPVDTMGCHTAHHKETDEKNKRFITLVSLMLSPQTKDDKCNLAVENLQQELGGTVSIDAILATSEERIAVATKPAGFRKKARFIKETAQILRDRFDFDVPKTVDDLCTLPGVGEKIAFLTLQVAWGINTGIGVDVHVHRITNRLGWHKPQTKTPDETRLNLQSWLPKELYRDINTMLVGFGQMICLPVSPRCNLCPVRDRCPSAVKTVKAEGKRREIKFSGPKIEITIDDIRAEGRTSINQPLPLLDNPRTRIVQARAGTADPAKLEF